ncbi:MULTISPECIES: molecular chaperone [Enterobacteriaceae]|uniref:fimbrial biogenesis chaperone n=1 Tax=Enterobacteriaceae TaxID=543 RepID=UPI000BE20C90|nr:MULTISPECIES: molecular chaperone [Enterobacteriaceae]EBB6210766.1 molecular chaperone [Salmonella enterica]EBM0758455.1 molecular chaperone [Salmonella enterica subsp. enterica serovar Muenchen]EBZ4665949.1 molecular chaperone [Salmonella enterica subsp. enterica serovar Bovismorbificans]ECH8729960.1 molecular chaperone [Salmonella enterica subsp. enterica]ECH8735026.1 molecular chaperone [Salmonella enterica subsp. enterica serovar Wandsworth]EGI6307232.1 molecular chaperone [Salmonella 
MRRVTSFAGQLYQRCRGYLPVLFVCIAGVTGCSPAKASQPKGIGFSLSRVVMMAVKKGGSIVEVRNGTDKIWLMQSRVLAADPDQGIPVAPSSAESLPFLVLPPLKRMDARDSLILRVVAAPQKTAKLPKDRESLFFLSSKAIPAISVTGRNTAHTGSVSVALENDIKLFYRPAGLAEEALDDVAGQLQVRLDGDKLRFTNPSPYFITFAFIQVNGHAVADKALRPMIGPKSSQLYPLPQGVNYGDVSWALIDEYGLLTKTEQKNVR